MQLLRKFSQWCGWFGNPPLNGAAAPSHIRENKLAPLTRIPLNAAADLLPVWCHPFFWCVLKASQEWCSWSFLLPQRPHPLLCVLKASQVWCGWSFFLPQRLTPSLMRAESVPSMVRLVVLPSPKALNSLKIKNTSFLCESLQPLFDHPPFRLCAAWWKK